MTKAQKNKVPTIINILKDNLRNRLRQPSEKNHNFDNNSSPVSREVAAPGGRVAAGRETASRKQHNHSADSFVTLMNHKRQKDSKVNMNTIVADGYKLYNQYRGNRHRASVLNNFRYRYSFDDYSRRIPKHKFIRTKNGVEYDVDDLVLLLMTNANNLEPIDITERRSVCENESEENMILGHPGLSSELRTQYMEIKKKRVTNIKEVCELLKSTGGTGDTILENLGKYGVLFANIKLSNEQYCSYMDNLITLIGNDVDSPLLNYEVIPEVTFKSILIAARHEKPSQVEFGYYLMLVYFQLITHCNKLECDEYGWLPYFRDLSPECGGTVYAGTIVHPDEIDINKLQSSNKTMFSKLKDYKHNLLLYIPEIDPYRLIITNVTISNDVREDLSAGACGCDDKESERKTSTKKSDSSCEETMQPGQHVATATDGLDLAAICPELESIVTKDIKFFSGPRIMQGLLNLYNELQCNLN